MRPISIRSNVCVTNEPGCSVYLKELIEQSWISLVRNRMRSTLTMLGIGWGVVSVVLLLAFGEGLGGTIVDAVSNLGNNVIVL